MRFVTAVNRTNKTLHGCWDGKHYNVPPGKNALDEQRARAVKLQNPIMGSDDPLTGNLDYYIGVEEDGDDCSPVEFSKEIELYSSLRSKAVPVMIVPGKAGMFNEEIVNRLPTDGSFVKA
jgi:hypothetical protein